MIFKNILLAFQLENYYNIRFLKFIYSHPKFWIFGSNRQELVFTSKAKLILILSILLLIFDVGASLYFLTWYNQLFSLAAIIFCIPLYFVIANIFISPIDSYIKKRIITKAKKKISQFPNLKIIAITGSMGKTTTKEFLHTILQEKFNVLATQGTKNTPLWISRLILQELNQDHEIFIVEMGAYERWNIAELCNIAKPNISVITWITLQHLERFWSLDEIIDTKFEIMQALDTNDFAVIDVSTPWAQKWLDTINLGVKDIVTVKKWTEFTYLEKLWWIRFKLDWNIIQTKILSDYVVETLSICWHIAKKLWMNIDEFNSRIEHIEFVEHRMQLIHNTQSNVYVIDDSFNGNIEGIKSIVHLLRNAPFSGRKILIAGWVVELWEESDSVNQAIWQDIATAADMVLLVEGPIWNAIEVWLMEKSFKNIKKYSSPLHLHEDLKNITQSWDMIIFQNDLPDTYL